MNVEIDPLRVLYDEYRECTRCKLSETRQRVVFGSGNPEASILLITDTPTLKEEQLGHHNTTDIRWVIKAFKHALGKNDMPIGAAAELFFNNVFMTNAVMCCPTIPLGDKAGELTEPSWSLVKKCRDRLLTVIYEVDPLVIVAAGKYAVQALVGRSAKLPTRGGRVSDMRTVFVPGECGDVGYSFIPTADPRVAERRGDYDDPTGTVSSFTNALAGAWQLKEYLENEDR
jgi:uracil-DNA glycosylase family 4